jgi:hypothetical protein
MNKVWDSKGSGETPALVQTPPSLFIYFKLCYTYIVALHFKNEIPETIKFINRKLCLSQFWKLKSERQSTGLVRVSSWLYSPMSWMAKVGSTNWIETLTSWTGRETEKLRILSFLCGHTAKDLRTSHWTPPSIYLFIFLLLFICAYKAWVISPPCPHPLRPLPLPPWELFFFRLPLLANFSAHCLMQRPPHFTCFHAGEWR